MAWIKDISGALLNLDWMQGVHVYAARKVEAYTSDNSCVLFEGTEAQCQTYLAKLAKRIPIIELDKDVNNVPQVQ